MKAKQVVALMVSTVLVLGAVTGCGANASNVSTAVNDEEIEKHIKSYLDQHMDEYLDQYYERLEKEWEDSYDDDMGGDSTEADRTTFSNLKSFQADTIEGGTFSQDDISKKDVTVINFWSLMCGYCVDELPEIAKFADELPDNVQVITVCLDLEGDEEIKAAKSTLEDAGFHGTTLIKGSGDFETVCKEIQYTPTTIFVDKDGNTVGDAIISAIESGKLQETYIKSVNDVLKTMGKAEIK